MQNSINPIQTITLEQEDKLISYLSTPHRTVSGTFRTLRNKLAVLLMLDAGLRVGEAAALKVLSVYTPYYVHKSIQLTSEMTKTKTARTIPISERLTVTIREMLTAGFYYADPFPGNLVLYASNRMAPLTTRQLERIVKAAAIKSIGRPIHPHVLRHTFATKLMRIAPMPVVQALLGHKHLSSTQVYVHPNAQDLTDAISQLHQPPPDSVDRRTECKETRD